MCGIIKTYYTGVSMSIRITETRLRQIIREEIESIGSQDPNGPSQAPSQGQWTVEITLDAPPGRSHMPIDLLGDRWGEWSSGGVVFGEQTSTSKQRWATKDEALAWATSGLWAHVVQLYNDGRLRYADYSAIQAS